MATTSQLTDMLRQAHIVSLKQRYLDLIEEARQRKDMADRVYFEAANEAYVTKMQGFKNKPQQLKSLGLGGGRGDEEISGIIATYEDTMGKLQKGVMESIREFEYVVDKQTRLMNNALAEYNARIALEDYNSAAKTTSKGGGSSASSSKVEEYVPPESKTIVPSGNNVIDENGRTQVFGRRKTNPK